MLDTFLGMTEFIVHDLDIGPGILIQENAIDIVFSEVTAIYFKALAFVGAVNTVFRVVVYLGVKYTEIQILDLVLFKNPVFPTLDPGFFYHDIRIERLQSVEGLISSVSYIRIEIFDFHIIKMGSRIVDFEMRNMICKMIRAIIPEF